MAIDLGVEVREDAALQQRVFREVNATNDMARLELLSGSE